MQDYRSNPNDRRPTICLLMDVANIPEESIVPLVQELRRRGDLAAMFAFGDWHRRDMHLRHRLLDALGFLCIHGGSWENGSGGLKSMVDSIMKRTIKWMPQWFPNCDTYVLATGDRDFSHDASDLRWRGFRVWITAGESSINNELRLGADEFIGLDRMPGRVAPSAVLGVPSNYYESTFGQRGRSFRGNSPAAPEPTPPPAPMPVAPTPTVAAPTPPAGAIARSALPAPAPALVSVAPAPAPIVVARTSVVPTVLAPPTVVLSDEDRALLAQLRELSGGRGFVAQREALRALAPADDPGGRVRSRLSNQIRDLVERGLLARTHAIIGGNVTQVLALPGLTADLPAPQAATAPAEEAVGPSVVDRRPRSRLRRRVRSETEGLLETPPVPVAPASPAVEMAPPAVAPSAAVPAVEPLIPAASAPSEPVVTAPSPPRPIVPSPEPPRPESPRFEAPRAEAPRLEARPLVAEEPAPPAPPRWGEPSRPAQRRSEAPISRPLEPAVEPAAPAAAPSRPSWRDAVAAALAQARGDQPGRSSRPIAPSAPPVAVVATPPPPSVEASPPEPPPMPAMPAVGETPAPPIAPPRETPVEPVAPPAAAVAAIAAPEVTAPEVTALAAMTPEAEASEAEEATADGAAPAARRRRRRRPASATSAPAADGGAAIEEPVAVLAMAEPAAPPTDPAAETPSEATATGRRPRRRGGRRPSGTEATSAAPGEGE